MLYTHKLIKGLIFLATFCCFAVCPCFADDTNEARLLGDIDDGSRSVAVHNLRLHDEEGRKINPDDFVVLPFSTKQTCGACHNYDIISKGWHFNAIDANAAPGRKAQPWIFADARTVTQIPLSYRKWEGVYHPEQLGISPWKFTELFGRHMPGGGPGELDTEDYDEIMRQSISGKLEINCLSCHNGHSGQDQSEYASQTALQNFRWAATAACEFASVAGSAKDMSETWDFMMPDILDDPDKVPPTVKFTKNIFDYKNRVLFDITRKVPDKRCYFCHSNKILTEQTSEKWMADEDVHLAGGLSCVDCHRNGLEHRIVRGYECETKKSSNPLAGTSTCESCHKNGRMGAPVPKHPGIPVVHFTKLTCTACHSGPKPVEKAPGLKTSRAHALGTHFVNKSDETLPHITTAVMAGQGGKIAPYNLIWPAFWGSLKEGQVAPISISIVKPVAAKVISKNSLPRSGDWPEITSEQIKNILTLLTGKLEEGVPVYICGGKLYQLDKDKLKTKEHEAGKPYLWPIAHNVRSAAQSLGAKSCGDCHSTDSAFFFASVAVDSPLGTDKGTVKKMFEFQGIDQFYTKAFAWSFMFRPWFKIVTLCSCAIISLVLLLYGLRALACITKTLAGKD